MFISKEKISLLDFTMYISKEKISLFKRNKIKKKEKEISELNVEMKDAEIAFSICFAYRWYQHQKSMMLFCSLYGLTCFYL